MKRVFYICVKDEAGFDLKQGWVLEENAAAVRSMLHQWPGLHVIEKHPDMVWPGPIGNALHWING